MRKTIFATIIAAGLLAAVPAHADRIDDDITYCKYLSEAAMGVAKGRDEGYKKILYQMVALRDADAPIQAKVDMMDTIELIYNDKTMRQMTPQRIAHVIFGVCLRAQQDRRK